MPRAADKLDGVFVDWFKKTQGRAASSKARIQEPWTFDKWEEFNNVPVSTLIEDPYYFGWRGQYLYDCHKQDIVDLFHAMTPRHWGGLGQDIRVFIDEEGTRSGKTWKASIVFAILLFKNIIIPDFHAFYPALAPNSGLGFLATSRELQTTREVIFKEIILVFLNSEFFVDYFPPQIKREQVEDFSRNPGVLKFPHNIAFQASSAFQNELQGLGYTIICALCDEVNFYPLVRDSRRTSAFNTAGVLDSAQQAFDTLYSRIDNQFAYKGSWPCWALLEMFSSAGYNGDFTDRHIQQARNGDTEIFYRKRTTVEARRHTYSGHYVDFDIDSFKTVKPLDEIAKEYERVLGKPMTKVMDDFKEVDLE